MSDPSPATPSDLSPLSATTTNNSQIFPDSATSSAASTRKPSIQDAKRYSCQFCSRAFSRSEHRSRHERSHTKERPFKCLKCRSTFVRRDLLLRHDRTVHAKDGGVPLQTTDPKRRQTTASQTQSKPPSAANSSHSSVNGHDYAEDQDNRPVDVDSHDNHYLGLEEAAMLMTNFQQKAAMTTHDQHHHHPHHQHIPTDPALEDSSSSARMQWEPSMTDSRSSLPYPPSAIKSVPHTARGPAIDPAIAAATTLASQAGSKPTSFPPSLTSGLATPESFSPLPQTATGPSSPNYTRSSSSHHIPQIETPEQMSAILSNIDRCDTENSLMDNFQLPEAPVLNRYLATYFNYFHHHMPFLHQPSFEPAEVAAPLMLSVLSIGALYTFEQTHAYMLHIGSKILVNEFLRNEQDFDSRKSPLWAMQATLLNMMFASWSGDIQGLEWACSIKSLVANMVAGNRYELKSRTQPRAGQPTHREWIEDEGCRRTYYAVYIFFGLLTLTFNHTPAISFNEFDALELPSSESAWNAAVDDDETWLAKLKSSNQPITFRQAHDSLFQGETMRYSAFATRVMINALFLEVWYHKRSPEALQDMVTEYKLRLALDTWHKSLEICEAETSLPLPSTPGGAGPLMFNAMAMYRNTLVRLVVDLMTVQEALRYHNPDEVASAMLMARDKITRSEEMLKAVQTCLECIEVAATQGIRWVARTAATNWSVEHPLCGLDMVLILSHWFWLVEHDGKPLLTNERIVYDKLRDLFDDDSKDALPRNLGATVATLWGNMIDEVVVWGITKLMGESFKLHARALTDPETSSSHSGQ